MSLNIRIDETTHATLRELAEKDDTSLQEEARRAVEAYRRQRFFEEMAAAHASLTPEQLAEDAAELAIWDRAESEDLDKDWTE
ncbi:MAG TPA: hypothetical protein VK550_22100 [Polyangiaceae bacterium]|nr:hypothetical protein [Polyangiaceae bacterium]